MPRGRRPTVRAALAPLLFGLARTVAAQDAPLYVVPTDDRLGVAVADERPLRLELDAVDRDRLLAALGAGAVAVGGGATVRVDLDRNRERPYVDDSSGRWLAASFIVDFDQPAVTALREEFLASAGGVTSPAALVTFVERRLDEQHGNGWEPASQTARTRRGDCTEHAVLTAALARSLGIPARVAIGMVVVRPGDRYATFGHAWAEVRDGDRWVVADAALGAVAAHARYLPLGLLEDEGPGFLLQMLDTLTAWATRVVVPGPGG